MQTGCLRDKEIILDVWKDGDTNAYHKLHFIVKWYAEG